MGPHNGLAMTDGRATRTYHCAACNGHFHSEASYAAHREPEGCIEPADDARFVALTQGGVCRLGRTPTCHWGTTIPGIRSTRLAGSPGIRPCSASWSP